MTDLPSGVARNARLCETIRAVAARILPTDDAALLEPAKACAHPLGTLADAIAGAEPLVDRRGMPTLPVA
jgi:hypothetical protein